MCLKQIARYSSSCSLKAVRVRSFFPFLFVCFQIDAYNEEILSEERERLRDTNPFTILEYIKTSIEILMNMKMEEQQEMKENNQEKRRSKRNKKRNHDGEEEEETESAISGDEAPSEYESMLQKYEAEVRNHIKIEQ